VSSTADDQNKDPGPPAPEGEGVETLDATVATGDAPPKLESPREEDYNPDRSRDQARARITYWLLFLFTLLILFAFFALYNADEKPTFENLKAILELLLGPVVALVSAATGFYFGAQSVGRPSK